MKDGKIIKVGIKTKGLPEIERRDGITILRNMLIGDQFHWEKEIEAQLPGRVYHYDITKISNNGRTDNVSLINELPIEKYLECVVGSEMNPNAPIEFLKAHAVISRGWALGKVLKIHNTDDVGMENLPDRLIGWEDTHSHHGFDVCSDDHCQRYQGLQKISPQALASINSTEGEVLTDRYGKLIDTRFSKCCGGRTEIFSTCWQDREEAGLRSFDDPWCDLSNLEEVKRQKLLNSILKDYDTTTQGYGYKWKVKITKSEIERNLFEKFGRKIGKILNLQPIERGPSGRIKVLRITGTEGILDIGKELMIRKLLSSTHLYSSAFELENSLDYIELFGHGWGHGVGLCQIGAANMALNGYGYKEILSFYYPGSKLTVLL